MADNFVANPGTGGDTFAADDVSGVKYPRSKVGFGSDGAYVDVDAVNPLPVDVGTVPVTGTFWPATQPISAASALTTTPEGTGAAFWPSYKGVADTSQQGFNVDTGGALITRGAVTTDEGTFRVNFANTSLAVSIGSVTVSGKTVTGSGFLAADVNYHDYFKLDADAESAWSQIDYVVDDTTIMLTNAYTGGASGAASRALVVPITQTGGGYSVASGQLTMTSGTTSGGGVIIGRIMDYGPLVFRARLSISQRVANNETRIGFAEPVTVTQPRWTARFIADGTVNTTIKCESSRNPTTAPSAAETETTVITIPNGGNTSQQLDYRIEQLTESVRFYISGVLVAEHSKVMPAQSDVMVASVRSFNPAVPASSTTVVVDFMTVKNHNKLEIGVMSNTEQIVAAAAPLQQFTYSVAGVIPINTDLIAMDCSQLRSIYIQCNSMGTTGVVTVQWSNEPTFAQPITATLMGENGATSTTFNAAAMRVTNVIARYCRLRLTTATTAGTTTLNVWGAQTTYTPIVATQPVSGTVTANVTGYPTAAASADGLANPTVTKIDTTSLLYNGTTWDRQRNNVSVALDTSSARTASGNGATFTNHNARGVSFWINVTAVSGTVPTMTIRIQWSPDNGTTWIDMDTTNLQTSSITGNGNFVLRLGPGLPAAATLSANQLAPRLMRLAWTIGGTTPSFTFVSWVNTSS